MLWALLLSMVFAEPAVTGVVKDSTGRTVAAAAVVLKTDAGVEQRTVTGPDGRFSFPEAPSGNATITVKASGFAEATQTVTGTQDIEITLALKTLSDMVTVTPTRTEQSLGDVPASVNVVEREEIQQSPAVIADDVLRQVPTFSLFRRTTAVSANPTAQGVSLRGIGPSGVSRTLVLMDNVPVNDPFGGWVYWTKIPMEDVEHIDLVNGSSSSLYGNYAMGGVINIVSRSPQRRAIELRPSFGSRTSPKLDVFGSDLWGKVGLTVNGSFFDTDGFPQVIENERGPVDTDANVAFQNIAAKIDYAPATNIRAFVRGGFFTEDRHNAKVATANGTPVGTPNGTPEVNDTIFRSVNTGVRALLRDQSDLQATIFYDSVTYHQNFLAVPDPVARNTARVTLNQKVPTQNWGGMVQWSRAFGAQHYFTGGTDWRWVDGESQEYAMDTTTGTTPTLYRESGGTQRSVGAFVQDLYTPTERATITLSMRLDNWRNYNGHNNETNLPAGTPGAGNRPNLEDRDDTVGSPRVAALYRLTPQVNVWGDYAYGFRAPTLNELYRQFRVGQRLTLANENLGPERLRSGEIGVNLALPRNLVLRETYFDNRMENPVSTIVRRDLNAAGNTVQRTNLGRTRIHGFQTDADVQVSPVVKVSAGYLFNLAKVTENEIDPTLVGNYLVQVPKNRGSVSIAYTDPKIANLSLALQFVGRQFDDEANTATVPGEDAPGLPAYTMVDFNAGRTITRNLDVFLAVQNMFNVEYIVQTAPTTIGAPRLVSFGLRFGWNGR
jgi:outer membrane receptor protein involved in Fe transport